MADQRARPTIAVDGPAASGKGTVARALARELGYQYVDTGAMYRTVALVAAERGVDWADGAAVAAVASGLAFAFAWAGGELRVSVDGRDVTADIRSGRIGEGASAVSAHPEVRAALLELQRGLGRQGGVVMDGRDIGTVVLPHAELKIYLDADLHERARRRHVDLVARGEPVALDQVVAALAARDARDMGRAVAPLRPADDAAIVDTTALDIPAAIQVALELARERLHLLSR